MRVIMVQERFVSKVLDGSKPHTIRKSARCKPGDILSIRRWTGKPYRSKQQILREEICTAVRQVRMYPTDVLIDSRHVSGQHLAVCDGFRDWDDMREWFEKTHSLPFDGFLICWSPNQQPVKAGQHRSKPVNATPNPEQRTSNLRNSEPRTRNKEP